jgi:aconitase A
MYVEALSRTEKIGAKIPDTVNFYIQFGSLKIKNYSQKKDISDYLKEWE